MHARGVAGSQGLGGGPGIATQPRRPRHGCRGRWRRTHVCAAQQHDAGWVALEKQGATSKLRAMLEYVEHVEPTMVNAFTEQAPSAVVDAIRTTVCGVIGRLPPQFFEVSVRSHSTTLEQLLYTQLLQGFLFRQAMMRVELKATFALPAAADDAVRTLPLAPDLPLDGAARGQYAAGTQLKDVSGSVLKWHHELGAQSVPVQLYIQQLEAENARLRQEADQAKLGALMGAGGNNPLLNELAEVGDGTAALTGEATDDVHLAFRTFVDRQLGPDHAENNPFPECSANEMAYLLFYAMAVGYTICSMHVRESIASSLDQADYDDDDFM